MQPHVVHETLIEDHRTDGMRSGEGAVVALDDGSLLMMYGTFDGGADDSPASIVTRRSNDGGLTWSDKMLFLKQPPNTLNLMSVSLLRLSNGDIACTYLVKTTHTDCRPAFTLSHDCGRTWSAPVQLIAEPAYYTVNNDRLIQLASGRLLLPFAVYDGRPGEGNCGCFISDDLGKSWHRASSITIDKAHTHKPQNISPAEPKGVRLWEERDVHAQEPGVVELLDGRVMMWARTTGGYAYRALSDDAGETWGPFDAITEFAMPCSPQSIQRLPGSRRLIMLYNDRDGIPFASREFFIRKPLAIAVSDDDANSWQPLGLLEPDTVPSNCYYSICAHGKNMIFTYYEGAAPEQPDHEPRNLASLKLKIVRQSYFLQP